MTLSYQADNERIKRRYFAFLKEAKQQSEASVDAAASAIDQFERYNRLRSFKAFRIEQAIGFKNALARRVNERTQEPLSKATACSTLNSLRAFFQWLSREPGYRQRLSYSDADYFNLSLKDTRAAKRVIERNAPTIDQLLHVLRTMPAANEIGMRDRAAIAFVALTGTRDSAVSSLKIKHVDIDRKRVFQDGREVRTKFSKTFASYFFPVGDEITGIFVNWVRYLIHQKQWGQDDPLFPATAVALGPDHRFVVSGLQRRCWANAAPIRQLFRSAFEQAGLPYFNPHSLRKTLVLLGQRLCRNPEEFKAWSQNLGHDDVLTTFTSYGEVSETRQAAIIGSVAGRENSTDETNLARDLVDFLARYKRTGSELPTSPRMDRHLHSNDRTVGG